MSTGYYARLRKGTRKLDIDSGNYSLNDSFVPPSASEDPIIGESGGASRRGGSERVDVNATNQAFGFELNISGDNGAEMEAAAKKVSEFLNLAGDESEPLYLDWIPRAGVSGQPIFGQWNNWRSLEIVWGMIDWPDAYATERNAFMADVPVRTIVKPYAVGAEFEAGYAIGSVTDAIWPEDAQGEPTGVRIAPSGTNLIPNSSFEVDTTGWNNANIATMERSTQESYDGRASLRLFDGASAGSGEYAQTDLITGIVAGTKYTFSAYIKKTIFPSAVGVSAIRVWWYTAGDVFISSNTLALDQGTHDWKRYVITAEAPATAAKAVVGIALANSALVDYPLEMYVDAILFEASARVTPYYNGDHRACYWSGTAHNSTSVRAAGRLIVPAGAGMGKGTVVIEWTPDASSSAYPTGVSYNLLYGRSSAAQLIWDPTNTRWELSDGNNACYTTATSFTKDTPVVFHCVMSPNGAAPILYVNGVNAVSASYAIAPLVKTTEFVLGSVLADNHIGGIFTGLQIYPDYIMSAAEVLADYNDMEPLVSAGVRVDNIPYIWAGDETGDERPQLLNCNDAADALNYAIVCQVPGSVEAITRIRMNYSTQLSTNSLGALFLSRMLAPVSRKLLMKRFTKFYGDLSGTSDSDSSGAAFRTEADLTTTEIVLPLGITMTDELIDVLSDQEVGLLARMADLTDAGNLQIRMIYGFGPDSNFFSEWKTILSGEDAWVSRLTRFLGFKDIRRGIEGASVRPAYTATAGFSLGVKRSSGTGDIGVDYYQIVTHPTLRIWSLASTYAGSIIIYDSKTNEALNVDSSDDFATDLIYVDGSDPLEVVPGFDNYLIYAAGDIEKLVGTNTRANALIIEQLKITPRYRLM